MAGLVALAVVPPAAPGDWHRIGPSVAARPGKAIHFFRTAQSPHGLSIVVTAAASRSLKVTWSTYCEFESDDAITEEHQGVARGVRSVTVYPSVFTGATLCYVSVNVAAAAKARLSAAVFQS